MSDSINNTVSLTPSTLNIPHLSNIEVVAQAIAGDAWENADELARLGFMVSAERAIEAHNSFINKQAANAIVQTHQDTGQFELNLPGYPG